MTGKPGIHGTRLSGKARIVHPSATAHPFSPGAAQKGCGDGGRHRGVADPHLAHDQKIGLGIHRVPAG